MPTKPLCVGHEIIGKVLRVGPKVKSIKVGDRVGVGAQVQACMKCPQCKSDNENYCPHQVGKSTHSIPTSQAISDSLQIPMAHHTSSTEVIPTNQSVIRT